MTTAMETAVQPVNQALADYESVMQLHRETRDIENGLRKAQEKESAAHAKWVSTVVQAVRYARMHGADGDGPRDWPDFLDFAIAIKNDKHAWDDATMFSDQGDEEDEISYAFGFGMCAGMMYAAVTGITLTPQERTNLEEWDANVLEVSGDWPGKE